MWNIEIGESVPGTWEPLPCFMVNAEVETSWQPSIHRNGQRPNGERASSKFAWAPSQSVSCIPIQVTAWICWDPAAIRQKSLVVQKVFRECRSDSICDWNKTNETFRGKWQDASS